MAHEILNCEISQLLEKFFEAPEPKQPEQKEEETSSPIDAEDGVCTVDDLGASSEDKDTASASEDSAKADDEESKEEANASETPVEGGDNSRNEA